MKKINYEEILEEAKRKEQSPHTIIKRLLKYRATGLESLCKNCKNINIATIDHKNHTGQCEVIGEGFNEYSAVNLKFTCDNHKK